MARSPGIASFEGSVVLVGTRDLYIDRYRTLRIHPNIDSGSSAGNGVEVRILSWAPTTYELQEYK